MRRVLFSITVLIVLWFGGRAIVRFFTSDETKIRWTVEAMLDGFNATRMDPVLDGLDREFLDESFGADRAMVRSACAYLFFQSVDPATKKFLYRAEGATKVDKVIEGAGDEPDRAEAQIDVSFFQRRGETEALAWKVLVLAKFVEDGGEWRIQRSETRTVEGERLR